MKHLCWWRVHSIELEWVLEAVKLVFSWLIFFYTVCNSGATLFEEGKRDTRASRHSGSSIVEFGFFCEVHYSVIYVFLFARCTFTFSSSEVVNCCRISRDKLINLVFITNGDCIGVRLSRNFPVSVRIFQRRENVTFLKVYSKEGESSLAGTQVHNTIGEKKNSKEREKKDIWWSRQDFRWLHNTLEPASTRTKGNG